jgi:glycosyltransferase involved in cell wall biosynthesis
MTVNVAVCGRFHYGKYVRHLSRAGVLSRFYYAAKLGQSQRHLGGDVPEARNVFAKEYLIFGHTKLLGQRGFETLVPWYESLWQQGVLHRWKRADVFHFMLHGNAKRLIRRAREDGSFVLGEPVNSHPLFFRRIMNEERDRLGLPGDEPASARDRYMAGEGQMTDALLTGSALIKRSYVEQGHDASKIHVLRYGGDTSNFFPEASTLRDKKFRVICVAQITPRKGHVDLLEAWKTLNLPNAELLLVGPLMPEMEPVLERYEGQFRHLPHVPHHELRAVYNASDVFVLPSVEDGFAYVCAEAAACGLPVITTHNTGAAELFDDGRTGYVVPIRSPEAIAEKIETLYRDAGLRRSVGEAGLRHIRTQATWENYAGKLIELYGSIGTKSE